MSLQSLITNPTSYNPATGKLTILSIPGDDVESVNNPPSSIGVQLVDNTDPHNPIIRSLLNGPDITIYPPDVNGDVEIAYTGLPPNSVMNNLGTGEPVLTTITTGTLPVNSPREFKTLIPGTNIDITSDANEITISSTGSAAITMNNLLPGPTPEYGNVLTNPGTASSFDFKAIRGHVGINLADTDPNYIELQLTGMQPTILGGVWGNQNDDSIVIGYNNNAAIGLNTNSNVIGSTVGSIGVQDTNIIVTDTNFTTTTGTFTNSNIILSGGGSEIQNATNSNIMALALVAPTTDINNSIYIGDMNNTDAADKSICINSDLYGNNITMASESVYMGTGQNTINLSAGECHFDFKCPAWYYHDLGTGNSSSLLHYDPVTQVITHGSVSSGTTSQMLYYDSGTKAVTYGNLPAAAITMANPGAGVAIDVLMNPGTGSSFNFKSILASGGLDINTSGGNKVSIATMNVNYSTSVTPTSNIVLANNSTTTLTGWAVGVLQNMYNIGGLFNVVTGVYTTAPLANPFRIAYNLTFAYSDSNAAVTPVVITVQLYNQTDAIVQRQMKFRIDHTDTVSYTFSGITNLNNASKQYVFRIINPSLAGTQTVYNSAEFTNLMIDRLL